jgi:dihydrofolate synthase / folylpolyglutamate synthase
MDAYLETLNRIYNLRGGVIDLRLERMERALALFDHPEKTFPSFHVAGTNGKGSTAAILHRILCSAGYRTALYTSPHLVSFTERMRIDDEEITPDEVVALADEIWRRTEAANILLTFFEIVTVMAFLYFARRQVDAAVIEVGLGGRFDATNLVRSIVSVITTISKDHEAFLGFDIASIAREKAGIIKKGVPVVCGALPPEAMEVIQQIADSTQAAAYRLGQNFTLKLKSNGAFDYKSAKWNLPDLSVALRGAHQIRNAGVATAALEVVYDRFPTSELAIRSGLQNVSWPGRIEMILRDPAVIIDGAHNREGIDVLVDELRQLRGGRRIRMLFAVMDDKDWRLMLDTLAGVVDEIVFTRVSQLERSADPVLLQQELAGRLQSQVIPDPRSAVETLVQSAGPNELIVITGSLYLLGEVRPLLATLAQARQSGQSNFN